MKLYGLIGYPLGHSFSKQYFTEKFIREDLKNCSFELFPIQSIDDLPAVLTEHTQLKGLCVTIPYKEDVLNFVTHLSEEVKFIGASNSIKIEGKKLTAYNTDIVGFEKSFTKLLQGHHKKALILGTGGASKAIQYVLNKLGIEFLIVTRAAGLKIAHINYNMIDAKIMNEYSIIINASPVGTFPKDNVCPNIPYHFINASHYLYDLVYQPDKTLFLKRGEEKGATIKNGFEMLTIQAEASWKIWNSA